MFGLFGAIGSAFAVGLALFFYIVFFGLLYLCCPWWISIPATIVFSLCAVGGFADGMGWLRDTSNDAPRVTETRQPVKYDPTQMGKKENYVSFNGPKNTPSSSNGMNIESGNGGAYDKDY